MDACCPVFSTCLFCHASLGANRSIEHFPVGRRLAFDAARGRLWAVCPVCARWNLTPVESRWEAIDECERAYRGTRKRASTDNVGLARLTDGTDLVRIGQPLLPEFAAWRYARNYRRRNVGRALLLTGTAGVMFGPPLWFMATGAMHVAVPLLTGVSVFSSLLAPREMYWRTCGRIALPDGSRVPVTWWQAVNSHSSYDRDGVLRMELVHSGTMQFKRDRRNQQRTALSGVDAINALRDLIVTINRGAFAPSREEVSSAVRVVESSQGEGNVERDGDDALRFIERHVRAGGGTAPLPVASHSTIVRLAIEMALHEADERRALAGELGALYARWEEAERIARIADGELSPIAS